MTGVINVTKCFVAGTLVLTEDGEKPIEDIEVGDYVYASDPETGESGFKEVLWTYQRETYELVHVFVADEEILTTPNHPFWVESEWIAAGNLHTGDILTLADGSKAAICQIFTESLDNPVKVYNFEVEDFHTYYVTDIGVLVHNYQKGVSNKNGKPTSQSQMQKQVENGQAPRGVDRVDKPHVEGQQPHVHFDDGTSLNRDGTVHDKHNGVPQLSNKIKKWLTTNGWEVN